MKGKEMLKTMFNIGLSAMLVGATTYGVSSCAGRKSVAKVKYIPRADEIDYGQQTTYITDYGLNEGYPIDLYPFDADKDGKIDSLRRVGNAYWATEEAQSKFLESRSKMVGRINENVKTLTPELQDRIQAYHEESQAISKALYEESMKQDRAKRLDTLKDGRGFVKPLL